jgi:hypothetical protein
MDPRNTMHHNGNRSTMLYVGLAAGAAIGIAVALTRRGGMRMRTRRREPWEAAKGITRRFGDRSQELAARSNDLIERMRHMFEEGRKVVDDARDLWGEGRRLVRA